jgi:hypothetical protein
VLQEISEATYFQMPALLKALCRCMPLMKTLIILGICVLASCGRQSRGHDIKFESIFPDTSKTWAGQVTIGDFHLTRSIERRFYLQTLTYGTKNTELRIWRLSSSYDPQSLNILRKLSADQWSLRTVSFYRSKGDSIIADYTRAIKPAAIYMVNLEKYWTIPSQSDLPKGDSYGCMDGSNLLIELADSERFKLLWYRCPDINKAKDSVFLLAGELASRLNSAADKP